MNAKDDFGAFNAGYLAELYARYRDDPASVDAATQAYFRAGGRPLTTPAPTGRSLLAAIGAVRLAGAIRAYGHLAARIDPLGQPRPGHPALDLATHGLTEQQLRDLPATIVGEPLRAGAATALDAIAALRRVYAATAAYEFDHLRIPAERAWLQDAIEAARFRPPADPVDGVALLDRLTEVETFEQFLHRAFPGKTRFSLEGTDMLVPVLDEAIARAVGGGVRTVLLGMAHRGRLNVVAHVLGKSYAAILAEFKDPIRSAQFRDDLGWTGDVTYHRGAQRPPNVGPGGITVTLAPNPSHVEAADPVVLGMARAAATRADRPGAPTMDVGAVLPVLMHGDAAFAGQGVVAETLNLARLRGYAVGGTIHIIINNQLGFTTVPADAHSTVYTSDLARGFEIPVVHVNADDPEACLEAARLAWAYRREFGKDFLIDLVGYRRYGHNEGDEPSFTQPHMYGLIRGHPTVRALWARTLVQRGEIGEQHVREAVGRRMTALQTTLASLAPSRAAPQDGPPPPPPAGAAEHVLTAVSADRLRELHRALLAVPSGFARHPKLGHSIERRRTTLDDPRQLAIDWALAEQLALASVLADGVPVRLTGQDTERAAFSQRHAVFHDVQTGATWVPLASFRQARASFEICNSPLSENAALAFEYGYNVQAPARLVIWEAQYGDFVNGAQVVVDEFIVSARAKWGQTPSLVLLLPHGAEGQGPDHSSGRLERFLALGAETNLRVAVPTTAAQYFHLLRRQAALLRTDPLPLVVMTPKSLLRHPRAASSLQALADGRWLPVLDDAEAQDRPDEVRCVLLGSGKITVELAESDLRQARADVAIVRLEQLYPFPAAALRAVLDRYPHLDALRWVQEEPRNMGAWPFVAAPLAALAGTQRPVQCISRPANASPAEGSHARHVLTQHILLRWALDPHVPAPEPVLPVVPG